MTAENSSANGLPPVLEPVRISPGPWPFGLSLAWMIVLAAFMIGVQGVGSIIPFAVEIAIKTASNQRPSMSATMPLGTILGWVQIACVFAVVPAAWFLAWLRHSGNTAAYLGLKGFRWSDLGLGVLGVVLVGLVSEFFVTEVNAAMKGIFLSAQPAWLLWIAVTILAPVVEEIVFRGFVFEGLSDVYGGALTASLITSLCWSAIHLQYGLNEMAVIFLLGMVLGLVRHRSGSVLLCMLLHALNNAASVVYMVHEIKKGGE